MKPEKPSKTAIAIYSVAIIGTFLLMAIVVRAMYRSTQPAAVGQERAAERTRSLAELRAANTAALQNPGWADEAKGVVRLPIESAMKLALQEWKNPAAARSNLISRVDKAFPAPVVPPAVPEKKGEYE